MGKTFIDQSLSLLIKSVTTTEDFAKYLPRRSPGLLRRAILHFMRSGEISDDKLIELIKVFQTQLDNLPEPKPSSKPKVKINHTQYTNPSAIKDVKEHPLIIDSDPSFASRKIPKKLDYLDLSNDQEPTFINPFPSLKEFVHQSCFDEEFGYYSNISDELGFGTIASGHSQFGFAMCLLSKAMNHWIDTGRPGKFMMTQLSGGNGELELVILSLARIMARKQGNEDGEWKRFFQSLNFRTIDISKSLSEEQRRVHEVFPGQYDVIHGDATFQKTWNEVKKLGAESHFVFSNELLDMLFPEFYNISSDGEITKPHVVTKIKSLEKIQQHIFRFIDKDSEAETKFIKLFEEIAARSKKLNLFLHKALPKLQDPEVFIDGEMYKKFMDLLHENGLSTEPTINNNFEHLVINFPLQLSKAEEKELRGKLLEQSSRYIKKGDEPMQLFTDNQSIQRLYGLELPKQKVYHFDYFSTKTFDPNYQGLRMLRHYGEDLEVTLSLKLDPDGCVKFIHGAPHSFDTTLSVEVPRKTIVQEHAEFMTEIDKPLLSAMEDTLGLSARQFFDESKQKAAFGFIKAQGATKLEHGRPLDVVRST